MNSCLAVFVVLALTCAAFGNPADIDLPSPLGQSGDTSTTSNAISFFGNSSYGRLIEELIQNLSKAAQQARDAVKIFIAGLREEATKAQEKFQQNLESLRERLLKAISNVQDKFSSSGTAIRECIDLHSDDAEILLNTTSQKTTQCTNDRLQEANEMIKGLSVISDNAHDYAAQAYAEMKNCTQSGGNFLAVGSCLGTLAVRTEMKGAVFLAQSGLTISRINLYMATFPAALEVCAGSSLVSAGVGTAKIIMEIGSCSASSVYSTFYGSGSSS